MFQTFTGSSRRPRQVNLSGRNNNPFAAVQQTSTPRGSPNAVAQAQQERRARQQERDRLQAARTVQRTWRGHTIRQNVMNQYRQDWDEWNGQLRPELALESGGLKYGGDLLAHLRLLLQFATHRNKSDVRRVIAYSILFDQYVVSSSARSLRVEWARPLSKLAKIILSMVEPGGPGRERVVPQCEIGHMIGLLTHLVEFLPNEIGGYSRLFYSVLGKLILFDRFSVSSVDQQRILGLPLRNSSENSSAIYEGFLVGLLTIPDIQDRLGLRTLARYLSPGLLTKTLKSIITSGLSNGLIQTLPRNNLAWLLAYFIYIRSALTTNNTTVYVSDIDFVAVVSTLLSYLAEDIRQQLSIDGPMSSHSPMPRFIEGQIKTLINQENVTGLLTQSGIFAASTSASNQESDDASILAGYVLTLLHVFPHRGDEIRMWLYLGSTKSQAREGSVISRVPAIRFFWEAVTRTRVYQDICTDSRALMELLKGNRTSMMAKDQSSIEQEWRIILIFLELYTFVLKVMDDEEFIVRGDVVAEQTSWTRLSALDLTQIKNLTTFLKNFAFAMYWYAMDIVGSEETTGNLASYFGQSSSDANNDSYDGDRPNAPNDIVIPGISWISLGYLKGMVTSLLRMIYERE